MAGNLFGLPWFLLLWTKLERVDRWGSELWPLEVCLDADIREKHLKAKRTETWRLRGDLPIFRQGPTRKMLMMVVPRKGAVDKQPTQDCVKEVCAFDPVSGLPCFECVCV